MLHMESLRNTRLNETFTLVVIYTSIMSIMAIVVEMCWKIHQMDVKTELMNGFIEEDVYIEYP
jgi:hypothetical protein